MSTDRQEFENWYCKYRAFANISKSESGDYKSWHTQEMWFCWRLSRNNITVTLPDSSEFDDDDMSGAHQAICQIRRLLTEAGIKCS